MVVVKEMFNFSIECIFSFFALFCFGASPAMLCSQELTPSCAQKTRWDAGYWTPQKLSGFSFKAFYFSPYKTRPLDSHYLERLSQSWVWFFIYKMKLIRRYTEWLWNWKGSHPIDNMTLQELCKPCGINVKVKSLIFKYLLGVWHVLHLI